MSRRYDTDDADLYSDTLDFRDIVFRNLRQKAMEYIYELPNVDIKVNGGNGKGRKSSSGIERLPYCQAVYFVFHKDELVYVGKSVDLRTRWGKHQIFKSLVGDKIEEVKVYFQVYKLQDIMDGFSKKLETDEATFILIFKPLYNQRVGNIDISMCPRIDS